MFEQSRRLSEPLRWGRREKTVVAVLVACVVVGLGALGGFALSGGGSAGRKGCITVTFASTLGGARLHACGAEARSICAEPASYRAIGPDLGVACRHAGYPFARK